MTSLIKKSKQKTNEEKQKIKETTIAKKIKESFSRHNSIQKAKIFVKEFTNATKENAETQTFYNEFFAIFGIKRRDVARYEESIRIIDALPGNPPKRIDVFWPGVLLIEQKSKGKDLDKANKQANEYYKLLDQSVQPNYIMSSDFKTFHLYKVGGDVKKFNLNELVDNLHLFGFMTNQGDDFKYEEHVSTKAAEHMGKIHDELINAGYDGKDADKFLTRIAYCLFAEDSEIFDDRQFTKYIEKYTKPDGSDLGGALKSLFETLDAPKTDEDITMIENGTRTKRKTTLPKFLDAFQYIDGGLFSGVNDTIHCNENVRKAIIAAASFDWSFVSPSVFGGMFEGAMDPADRRADGSHYTSTENVLKVINPLFMDELWAEFEGIKKYSEKQYKRSLEAFQNKLSNLKFIDPACGSGSFLVTTYHELRRLEYEVIIKLHTETTITDSSILSKIDVDQFYGIELNTFPVKITETALWMADHLENLRLIGRYNGNFDRIPLKTHPNITRGDALDIEWKTVLPSDQCNYVIGNPPFMGADVTRGNRKKQSIRITGSRSLDYVCNWFFKAGNYINDNIRMGLVSTNSITVGEQVGIFWPRFLEKFGLKIIFAYKSFKWVSDTKKQAGVSVVITGIEKNNECRVCLIDGDKKTYHKIISPYMIGTEKPLPIVMKDTPVNNKLPHISYGTKPTDGGHYIFKDEQLNLFYEFEPKAREFMKKFVNGRSFLDNKSRNILDLEDIDPEILESMPYVMQLAEFVKESRLLSNNEKTKEMAETPLLFKNRVVPENSYLCLCEVSSEKREYLPIDFLESEIIPSNKLLFSEEADLSVVGILSSKMHMIWAKGICGRLDNRISYSYTPYKTFPLPNGNIEILIPFVKKIFECRKKYPNRTLKKLYDPDLMPSSLRLAHKKLDAALEKMYRKKSFKSDDERLKFLLEKYEIMEKDGQTELQIQKIKKIEKKTLNKKTTKNIKKSNTKKSKNKNYDISAYIEN